MSVAYSMYDALVSINVPDEKARAVIDAMEREMADKFATKADLKLFQIEISGELKLVRQEILAMSESLSKDFQIRTAALENGLTVRLGILMAAMIGAATALIGAVQYFR